MPVGLALAGTAAGVGVAGLGWSLLEATQFVLRRARVPVLPPGAGPIRLLHISDIHLVPGQASKRRWLRSLAGAAPDVVIDTGDNLAHQDAVPALLDDLAPLLAVPGAFVMGSNDYFSPRPKDPSRYLLKDPRARGIADSRALPTEELAAGLREGGWLDLTNRRDRLTVGGVRLELVGVDDPHLERDRFPEPGGSDAAARGNEGAASEQPVVQLGVTHAPYRRVLDRMHTDGADLILAGHTHGGQLCIPGLGALVTNCDLDRGRAKGLNGWPGRRPDQPGGEDSTWLHVSAGIGTSPYTPVRFACRPEATLLELVER